MRQGIVMVFVFVLVAGCKIRPWTVAAPPGDAPPEYSKGWSDGCETGFSVYGNEIYKASYSFKQDVNLVNNPLYFRAWNDGMNYCRHFIERYLDDGYWGGDGSYKTSLGGRDTSLGGSIAGFNSNFFATEGGDWLGRSGQYQTDWLGRPGGGSGE